MILILFSLGYGLVQIPRNFYEKFQTEIFLHKIYHDVVELEDNKRGVGFTLQKYISIVNILQKREQEMPTLDNLNWIEAIKKNIPIRIQDEFKEVQLADYEIDSNKFLKNEISQKLLISLNQKVRDKVHQYNVVSDGLQRQVLTAEYMKSLVYAYENNDNQINSSLIKIFNRPKIFKTFPKFGRIFFIRNFLVSIPERDIFTSFVYNLLFFFRGYFYKRVNNIS